MEVCWDKVGLPSGAFRERVLAVLMLQLCGLELGPSLAPKSSSFLFSFQFYKVCHEIARPPPAHSTLPLLALPPKTPCSPKEARLDCEESPVYKQRLLHFCFSSRTVVVGRTFPLAMSLSLPFSGMSYGPLLASSFSRLFFFTGFKGWGYFY